MAITTALNRYAARNAHENEWDTGLYSPDETDSTFKLYGIAGEYYRVVSAIPVRTGIRQGIQYGLSLITTTNGYQLTMGDQNILKRSDGNRVNYPVVNVVFGREEYLSSTRGGGAIGYLPKKLRAEIEVTVMNIDQIRDDEMKAIRDIEYYFLQNIHLPTSDGTSYCIGHVEILENRIVGSGDDAPYGKVVIPMSITYLQNFSNPYATTIDATGATSHDNIPATVTISKRDDVHNAIKSTIEKITIANGYNNTMSTNKHILSINKMVNKPFINIVPEQEEYISVGKIDVLKHGNYRLMCFIDDVEDALTVQEKVIADLEKCFIANFYLPDSNSKRVCISCVPTYNEIKGMEENLPFYGVIFGIRVLYKQLLTNPAAQTE